MRPVIRLCSVCGTRVAETATRCIVCGADMSATTQPLRRTVIESQVRASEAPSIPVSAPSLPEPYFPTEQQDAREAGSQDTVVRGNLLQNIPRTWIAIAGGILTLVLIFVGVLIILISTGALNVGAPPENGTIVQPPPTFTAAPTITQTPLPSSTPLPSRTHIALDGDSCTGLALNYDVTLESILKLNGLTQNCEIQIGQEVFIPQPTHTPNPIELTATNEVIDPLASIQHIVEEGESLHSIAEKYSVDFDALASMNEISGPDYMISIEQELTISTK